MPGDTLRQSPRTRRSTTSRECGKQVYESRVAEEADGVALSPQQGGDRVKRCSGVGCVCLRRHNYGSPALTRLPPGTPAKCFEARGATRRKSLMDSRPVPPRKGWGLPGANFAIINRSCLARSVEKGFCGGT
ncbi:hypothetical protein MRX96_027219 [Rhipicephalus microplus]